MYRRAMSPTDINLDQEYSPSMNSHRFRDAKRPHEVVIENFITRGKSDTTKAHEKYRVRENVSYSLDLQNNELLDIYFKDQENFSPIFVYIHGGYWTSLDKSSSGSVIEPLIEHGYRVVCVDYNLCPQVDLQTLTQQIHNLFRWLGKYARETLAPDVAICGHSAGAHLACELFRSLDANDLNISSIFLISGLYDLRELWQLKSCNPGNILGLNAHTAAQLSPIVWLANSGPDFFHLHPQMSVYVMAGEFDSQTFRGQSQCMFDVIEKSRKSLAHAELAILANYDHFDIIESMNDANSAVSIFIQQRLRHSVNKSKQL